LGGKIKGRTQVLLRMYVFNDESRDGFLEKNPRVITHSFTEKKKKEIRKRKYVRTKIGRIH